mgnify:CR=1 FL=1
MMPVFSTQRAKATPPRSISTTSGLASGAALIASGTHEEQADFLASLTGDELRALPYLFEFWALPHQLPPHADWTTWVIMGGRGAGKTRAGAEWVRARVEGGLPDEAGTLSRLAIIGETYDQARDVMVFGESGIMACTPPDRLPNWIASERRLVWKNGAEARLYSAHDFEALRGPQFDGAWVDEIGCAAVDKGTNQPNKFLDPKSSESALPRYSNGGRDDLIQMQYLKVMRSFREDPANNPVSETGQSMVDTGRMFVWAWDARPYPFFPGNSEVWSDGGNYSRGHWITGRAGSRALANVVRDLCAENGVADVDTRELYGVVRGFAPAAGEGARASLQSLLLAYGADAFERDGTLVFRNRTAIPTVTLTRDELAWSEGASLVSATRAPAAEISGRVRLGFIEADSDYELTSVESIFPDEVSTGVAERELPLALTAGEAGAAVDRWLAEARVARDTVSFAVPPSCKVAGGDVLRLEMREMRGTFRVDRVEDAGVKQVQAVRVEAGVYAPAIAEDTAPIARPVPVPLPVWASIFDLPVIAPTETGVAPWIATTARPWPGDVAVYSSRDGETWRLDDILSRRSVKGQTLNDLAPATPGLWDRGPGLTVRLVDGALSSISDESLLAGGNTAILLADGGGDPEVLQFRDAELIGPETWSLSMRLRGQQGTDATMAAPWPAGSTIVLLDLSVTQLPEGQGYLEAARHYRVGPASKPVDHPSYVTLSHQAAGLALRPLAPAHLRARWLPNGDLLVTWLRRTRVDGDRWSETDVPIGETFEAYRVAVRTGGAQRREATVSTSEWTYSAADQAADALGAAFTVEVAQISDRVGPGHYARIEING